MSLYQKIKAAHHIKDLDPHSPSSRLISLS